jgi:hypothetical protein
MGGLCRWCHAPVDTGAPEDADGDGDGDGSAEKDYDRLHRAASSLGTRDSDVGLPEPVATLLVGLNTLAAEPAVQSWLDGPGRAEQVSDLVEALHASTDRIDSEGRKRDITAETKLYTLDEVWRLLLARDLVALLNALPGLGEVLAQLEFERIAAHIRHIDEKWEHEFHKAARKVHAPTAPLSTLRSVVPASA